MFIQAGKRFNNNGLRKKSIYTWSSILIHYSKTYSPPLVCTQPLDSYCSNHNNNK